MASPFFLFQKAEEMKYYKSTEEWPIWNLNKVNETGDVRYLIKGIDYFEDLPDIGMKVMNLLDAYKELTKQISEMFGLDESFITKMRDEKDLLIMALQILAGDKAKKAMKKVKEEQIKQREGTVKVKNQTFEEKIIVLESHFKKDFNVQQMTVKRFYTYLDMFKRANKK